MSRMLCASLVAGVVCSLSLPAMAVEIYASIPGSVVYRSPVVPVVYATPPPSPVVVYRSPVVISQPIVPAVRVNPIPVTTEHESDDPPTHPQPQERRDPRASVFIGGGYGGLTALRGGAANTYRLHLGVGLGATEIGLRADIANRALNDLTTTPGGVWLLSAEVAHRFLPGATVRPVVGASFDRWGIHPDGGPSASSFGMGARAGVEVHYHLNPGAALVFGGDIGYHRMLASVDDANIARDVMTFGATVDIRL